MEVRSSRRKSNSHLLGRVSGVKLFLKGNGTCHSLLRNFIAQGHRFQIATFGHVVQIKSFSGYVIGSDCRSTEGYPRIHYDFAPNDYQSPLFSRIPTYWLIVFMVYWGKKIVAKNFFKCDLP